MEETIIDIKTSSNRGKPHEKHGLPLRAIMHNVFDMPVNAMRDKCPHSWASVVS
jgi:hypothetical protein